MPHTEINFGPLASNVLDYVGKDGLQTPDGRPATIGRYGTGFTLMIGNVTYTTHDNIFASQILNANQVGEQT